MAERYIHSADVVRLMRVSIENFVKSRGEPGDFRIYGEDCRRVVYRGQVYRVDDRMASEGDVA